MKEDFTVTIKYKNERLEPVGERSFTFEQYCDYLSAELKHLILDIEDMFYNAEDGKEKEKWGGYNTFLFNKFRHKLLDCANAIERVPSQLKYKGELLFPQNISEALMTLLANNFSKKNTREITKEEFDAEEQDFLRGDSSVSKDEE